MLVDLIAFGLAGLISDDLGVATGTVTASARQTAALVATAASGGATSSLPVAATLWPLPFDPSDRAPYAYNWSALLASDEKVATIERVAMSAIGASLGVTIDQGTRRPMIDDGGKITGVWFRVEDAFQINEAFAGAGTQVGVAMLISTDADPPRFYERTAVLLVRQQ